MRKFPLLVGSPSDQLPPLWPCWRFQKRRTASFLFEQMSSGTYCENIQALSWIAPFPRGGIQLQRAVQVAAKLKTEEIGCSELQKCPLDSTKLQPITSKHNIVLLLLTFLNEKTSVATISNLCFWKIMSYLAIIFSVCRVPRFWTFSRLKSLDAIYYFVCY